MILCENIIKLSAQTYNDFNAMNTLILSDIWSKKKQKINSSMYIFHKTFIKYLHIYV